MAPASDPMTAGRMTVVPDDEPEDAMELLEEDALLADNSVVGAKMGPWVLDNRML